MEEQRDERELGDTGADKEERWTVQEHDGSRRGWDHVRQSGEGKRGDTGTWEARRKEVNDMGRGRVDRGARGGAGEGKGVMPLADGRCCSTPNRLSSLW